MQNIEEKPHYAFSGLTVSWTSDVKLHSLKDQKLLVQNNTVFDNCDTLPGIEHWIVELFIFLIFMLVSAFERYHLYSHKKFYLQL